MKQRRRIYYSAARRLFAVPVLAGSAADAVDEALGWHVGMARRLRRAPPPDTTRSSRWGS